MLPQVNSRDISRFNPIGSVDAGTDNHSAGHIMANSGRNHVSIESAFASPPLLQITSADRLQIRARILAAARQRFARHTHQETTIADIARAAALPVDEVQLHFADIRAVLVTLQRALDGRRPAYRRPQSTLVKARLAGSLRKDADRTLPSGL
jgi:hypothetical protein